MADSSIKISDINKMPTDNAGKSPIKLYISHRKSDSEQVKELEDLAKESGVGGFVVGRDMAIKGMLTGSVIGWDKLNGIVEYASPGSIEEKNSMTRGFVDYGYRFQPLSRLFSYRNHRYFFMPGIVMFDHPV